MLQELFATGQRYIYSQIKATMTRIYLWLDHQTPIEIVAVTLRHP